MDNENDEQNDEQKDYQLVFSKNVLEFATVAREYCVFAENAAKYSKADYLKVASRLLPLLYMKAALLPEAEQTMDGDMEEIVDYDTYESVRRAIRSRLVSHDDYLEVFKEDFQYSETPITASISEDMADIYQDIRNFCEQYHSGDNQMMNDAVAVVLEKFRTYWGQRLCNAQRAIHNALYSGDDLKDEQPSATLFDNDDLANDYDENNDSEPQNDDAPYFLRQAGMRLVSNKKK